jgi:Methylase involved in ubiquinone/menaquinone biosynthesis
MDNSFEQLAAWTGTATSTPLPVPRYLDRNYWWAYVHPWAIKFWDRQWLVNLILLTNYYKLRDAALSEFGHVPEHVLQIACVYGDLTPALEAKVTGAGGRLDVVDVLPAQLSNVQRKLSEKHTRLHNMDSTCLGIGVETFDSILIFFLMHEQPRDIRGQTLQEAFRILKPGGKMVLVDFALPYRWNPFRYLWRVFLAIFEPFALDMWKGAIRDHLPEPTRDFPVEETRFFGGLFRKAVITKPA